MKKRNLPMLSAAMMLGQAAVGAEFNPPVAIMHATIHHGDGTVVDDGTILVTDDRITAVGTEVSVPADAERIDCTGLHVYPAFIDAFSHVGVPAMDRAEEERKRVEDENPDVSQGPLSETRKANRRGIRPQLRVSDHYRLTAKQVEDYHRLGFGTALLSPRGGILGGSGALVSISDVPVRRAILDPAVGRHASFHASEPGDYPATLLGSIAALRQFMSDARWYQDMNDHLRRHPEAIERLPYDPALEAMSDAIQSREPLIFEAQTEVEILRALALAGEFDMPVWIAGGKEAYKVVDRLKSAEAPVIVTLEFDEEPEDVAAAEPESDKEASESTTQKASAEAEKEPVYEPRRLREEKRRLWEEQVDNLKTLIEANVPVAVGSKDHEKTAKLLENLRLAIEQGLGPKEALAALTTEPARLFGREDVLGSIESGKLANLVVMTRPFEEKKARVRWMFVAGERFEYEREEEEGGKKDAGSEDTSSEHEDPPTETSEYTSQPAAATESQTEEQEVLVPEEPDYAVELEADRKPSIRTGGDAIIRGGTIITVSGETIEDGDVLIRGGRIADVGRDLVAPAGVREIDATGRFVMPGIIDCHSHMALDAVNEHSLSITAEVRVADVIDHRQVAIYRALAGGVTTIHTMHGSANTIGGQNIILKLRYGKSPDEMLFDGAPATMKFALGENVTHKNRRRGRPDRFPSTRMGVESVLRQALIAADAYRHERRRHREQGDASPPLRRDLRLETLAAVLDGDIWVHCHGYRGDEYLRLIDVAEDFGFRLAVLQHVLEGYRIAPEIRRHGSGASTFSNDWAYKIEAYTGIPYNAAFMTRRGINVSVNSDSANTIRYMNVEAGKSVRWGGLDEIEALRLVTLNPAQQLGIADRVGSIEAGKDADLAIFNGPPLDSFSKCVMTLVDGEMLFEHPDPARVAPIRPVVPADQRLRTAEENPDGVYALVNGTIHPISAEPIERGKLLIRKRRIAALGAEIEIPSGATVIDVEGAHVYPGLIDAGGVLGLSEVLQAPQTRDEREIAELQPELRTLSAIHPFSEHIAVTRTSGITTALSVPRGGTISGRSDLIHLDGWTAGDMLVRGSGEPFALHVSVPSLPADLPEKTREERKKQHEESTKKLEDFLRRAKLYAKARDASAGDPDQRVPRDLRLEAMLPYVRGERPVVFSAEGYKEILDTLEFAEKHELRCVISGGREAWKCADLLAEKQVPVIIATVFSYPRGDYEPFDSVFGCAAALDRAGVQYCFASASAAEAFNLPIQVGVAVAHGLDPDRAMRALTLGAAEILGIEDEVGSLEPGKLANVIVTTDTPVQVTAGVTHMLIRGELVDLSSIHTKHLERFRQRPEPDLDPAKTLVGPPSLSRRPS